MSFVLADRVKETTTSPGTGTATLSGAVTGYQSFSAGIGANNTTYYVIADASGPNWEVGYGTVGAGGTTLARTTVLASSNSNSLVNFSSGTQNIWVDYPASKAAIADAANALHVDNQLYVNFQSAPGTTVAAGRMWYDDTLGNWNLGMGGGNITQQVGEELFVYGKASSTITEGQLIMKTGVVGASGQITFGPTTANLTSDQEIIGLATENITSGNFGRITAFGTVHGLNTSGFTTGDTLWYDPAGSGAMTATKPSAPNVRCQIGVVLNAGSGGSGSIGVDLQHGSTLGGTDSNVQLTSPTGGQLLTYDQTDAYWKNTSLTAGTGITVTPATGGGLTVTNASPDQTVSITGAGGASVTGTYPSFTITTPSGTVTSVSGTSPVASSGGDTPAISLASGYGDTQNPFASKTANYFLAAPNGSSGAPTFRAIVAADIPTLNQATTGQAGSVANALTAGTGISYSSGTTYNGSAAITISIPQAVATTSNVQFGSFGVGTAASGTSGEIRATNNVTAYYSDERLKTKIGNIENALDKVRQIETMVYHANETAVALGYDASVIEVGVTAQSVQKVQPQVVAPAPIDEKYMTVRYERLVPLLIEAIKELEAQVAELKAK